MRWIVIILICSTSFALDEETPPELADYMYSYQTLAHKLGLSIDAQNLPLVEFYLHELEVKTHEIQDEVPEYEGVAIAVFFARHAWPAIETLHETVESESKEPTSKFEHLKSAYSGLLNSCNACHVISKRSEIKIVHNPHNPYLQDFSPSE